MNIYENFHKKFTGSNENTFKTCEECGGACEYNKIGTLLPGEREYIAKKMSLNVSDFKARYLDILKMSDGTLINVLKLGKLCPFLNEKSKECECKNFKPIFCKIYPVIFSLDAGKINFKIDHWCKLSRKKTCRIYFETAIPLLSNLPIPVQWFKHVVTYDNLCFDYEQLKKYRYKKNRNAVFLLEEIISLQKTDIDTSGLCVDLCEKIEKQSFKLKTQSNLFCINREETIPGEIQVLD
jgi:Fe-S-cluster containining protein